MPDETLETQDFPEAAAPPTGATQAEGTREAAGGYSAPSTGVPQAEGTREAVDGYSTPLTGAPQAAPAVRPVQFAPLTPAESGGHQGSLGLLMDVSLQVTVELGRTRMQIRDLLQVGPGSVVELDKLAGEPVDVLANSKLIARGEVVVIDENFGVRITQIVNQAEGVGPQ